MQPLCITMMKERFELCETDHMLSCNFVVIINLFSVIFRLAESKISSIHEFLVIIYDHIMGLGRYHKQINIVCDRYFKDTLKDQTWIGRGIGTQIDFD